MGIDTFTRDIELREMYRFALQKHMLGELDYAERIYKLILVEVPADYDATIGLSKLKIQKGKFSDAKMLVERAISHFGNDPFCLYLRALTHRHFGNEKEAIADAKKALNSRPDFIEAHHLISEMTMKGPKYRDLLAEIHARLNPDIYLEIGVENGTSLGIATGSSLAIGVDPNMKIAETPSPNTTLFEQTSDDFFSKSVLDALENRRLDLTFIDGLHEAHQALRDFVNAEKHSSESSFILMHDVIPLNSATATPERHTFFWSGDVWRTLITIKRFFDDIKFTTIDSPPTGIAVLKNLNPNRKLSDTDLSKMYNYMDSLKYDDIAPTKSELLNIIEYSPSVMKDIFA